MESGSADKTWPMLCHLVSLTGYLGNGIGGIAGPLIVWLVKKDTMPEVDAHGKEAINFNLSLLVYGVCLGVCLVVFSILTLGLGFFLAIPLVAAMTIFHLVCTVTAAIKANNGEFYRYPLTIRFLK
jgi:uncharacterized protein